MMASFRELLRDLCCQLGIVASRAWKSNGRGRVARADSTVRSQAGGPRTRVIVVRRDILNDRILQFGAKTRMAMLADFQRFSRPRDSSGSSW